MIFILIIGAMIFSRFLVITEVPTSLADYIAGLNVPRYLILSIVLLVYLLIGCIMDIVAMLIVTIPILHPLLVGLGFNPVWLAVLTVITVLVGNVSPPVGIVVFALAGMVRDVSLSVIFRGSDSLHRRDAGLSGDTGRLPPNYTLVTRHDEARMIDNVGQMTISSH